MKARMLAVRVAKEAGKYKPQVAWTYTKQVPNVSSPLLIGGEMYFVSDNGIASCLDARTGEPHWTERIGKNFWASPLYADGRIYFFGREGSTTVITPGQSFERLAFNQLDGEMLATAAAVDNALILRTDKALYRVQ
jgi:outer membrane protein assembly factor BamB